MVEFHCSFSFELLFAIDISQSKSDLHSDGISPAARIRIDIHSTTGSIGTEGVYFGVEPAIVRNGKQVGGTGIKVQVLDTLERIGPVITNVQVLQLQVRAVFHIPVADKHIAFVA